MLNPTTLKNGQEQHESYRCNITRKNRVQYDYRHTDGEMFSYIKPTIDQCPAARDAWILKKEA